MCWYSWITSTRSPSFCMTTFSTSFTSLEIPLRQSRDFRHDSSRRILALTALWLQKHADLGAHDFVHCPDLWRQPKLVKFIFAWSRRLCEILVYCSSTSGRPCIIGFSEFEEYPFECSLISSWKSLWAHALWERFYSTIIYPSYRIQFTDQITN